MNTNVLKYPKMNRDDWRSVKLKQKDIDQIRDLYQNQGYNKNQLANLYGVSWMTIRRWVDEDFRLDMLQYNNDYRKERIKDEKYRKHIYNISMINRKTAKNSKMVANYQKQTHLTKHLSPKQHAQKLAASEVYREKHPEILEKYFSNPDNLRKRNSNSKRINLVKHDSFFKLFWENMTNG